MLSNASLKKKECLTNRGVIASPKTDALATLVLRNIDRVNNNLKMKRDKDSLVKRRLLASLVCEQDNIQYRQFFKELENVTTQAAKQTAQQKMLRRTKEQQKLLRRKKEQQ